MNVKLKQKILLKEIGDSYVYQTNQEFLLKKERV